MAMLHLRFDGTSRDIPLEDVSDEPSRGEIKRVAARALGVPAARLEELVAERHPNGNWTLRPRAVFG